MMLLRAAVSFLAYVGTTHGFVMNLGPSTRRDAAKFALAGVTGVLVSGPNPAYAVVKVNKSLGQESFRRIRDARKSLDSVDIPLRSRKFEEVEVLLDNGPVVDLEKSLVDLVKSNALPADDKVTVGTIRRYGLAADALIALGALSAAVRDEDGGEARRNLILSKESLNDILTIGVNNNLNRTD